MPLWGSKFLPGSPRGNDATRALAYTCVFNLHRPTLCFFLGGWLKSMINDKVLEPKIRLKNARKTWAGNSASNTL